MDGMVNGLGGVLAPRFPFAGRGDVYPRQPGAATTTRPTAGPVSPVSRHSGTASGFGVSYTRDGKALPEEVAPEDGGPSRPGELTEEEQKEVQELKKRDREVRQHEQAHLSVAGPYANGGAQFEYTRGPDGRQYATGGEVSIDVSPERTPEATIRKMRIVRRAALAPAEPSAQDRRVAAQASQNENRARVERAQQRRKEGEEGGSPMAVGPVFDPSRFEPSASDFPGAGGASKLDVRA